MRKLQRNQIFHLVEKHELDPQDFESQTGVDEFRLPVIQETGRTPALQMAQVSWKQLPAPYFKLSLRDSPLYFVFIEHQTHDDQFVYTCTRFTRNFNRQGTAQQFLSFNRVSAEFAKWLLTEVHPYLEERAAPDLWDECRSLQRAVDPAIWRLDDRSALAPAEQDRILITVHLLRHAIVREFAPELEQLEAIRERLNYLASASERLNGFDWQGLALSTLIWVSGVLSSHAQHERRVYELFVQSYHQAGRLLVV